MSPIPAVAPVTIVVLPERSIPEGRGEQKAGQKEPLQAVFCEGGLEHLLLVVQWYSANDLELQYDVFPTLNILSRSCDIAIVV